MRLGLKPKHTFHSFYIEIRTPKKTQSLCPGSHWQYLGNPTKPPDTGLTVLAKSLGYRCSKPLLICQLVLDQKFCI